MTTPALPAITKNVSQTQALSRSWGDCGNTANAVVNALRSAGFTIAATPRQTFPGAGQNANAGGAALSGLLLAPVAQPTLFNVDIDGVHIFVWRSTPTARRC